MGFSADWLALREPADIAARDAGLLAGAVAAAGADPVILDLGCGTGSTLRTLAPHLPAHARWHLVDNDPALLERAATEAPGRAETHALDLRDLDALPLEGVTLVTASALLDLMPAPWIAALAAHLAKAGLPFYGALSYDGAMTWDPAFPEDAQITRAFNDHQRGDKGLGPALGPDAATRAAAIFAAAGFRVTEGDSPWRLDAETAPLQRALLEGIAGAAAETGAVGAAAWGDRRAAAAADSLCVIGHRDLLALPARQP
ncbi:class I SAM-dependent methyltransferase [Paracoccus liaowanqingii]|uniref:Class I SAM-dependent methyltransferase n=1 Tax=Paracoccus liaowanqingii TaxID=2560053 RepID=A0A4Z1CRK9_9RHOB|nr:class I SAM-dependent methyltransferase [Paracoccus liaowanqingii]TGN67704.1 class I SAM-dependent methyltransferase [Paracoccus liaowanqingii]